MAQKKVTKKVRALRRRVRNHAIDGLAAMLELQKCDRETDHTLLREIFIALRNAAVTARHAWPTPEHVGIKMLGPGNFTVGN